MATVLVLGAGSSVAFGYPSGDGLRNLILQLGGDEHAQFCLDAGLRYDATKFRQFLKAFLLSDMASIDAFLARRTEFSEIGRKCIAAVLLRLEKVERLNVPDDGDKWASYVHRRFSAETWEQLDYSGIKIITFNYDRAFEHYMVQAIRYTYNKSLVEAVEKFKELDIVHIYGSLGPILPDEEGYMSYGTAVTDDAVLAASQSLKVIREGSHEDASLQRARAMLLESDRVVFLGFSFDATNLDRLAVKETCTKWIQRAHAMTSREIFATCYGMTEAEARRAGAYFEDKMRGPGHPPGFIDGRCIDLLRQTLVLD